MSIEKFVGEYPINASKRMLFPYLSTPSGLAQWFADDVNINEDKVFTFFWDGDEDKANLVSMKTNSHVKFAFFEKEEDDDDHCPYIELKLEMNELTQEVFIRVTDYSDIDHEEADALYDSLINDLKEIVGG